MLAQIRNDRLLIRKPEDHGMETGPQARTAKPIDADEMTKTLRRILCGTPRGNDFGTGRQGL